MSTLLYSHPASHRHVTPDGHPERVARIAAIEQALSAETFKPLIRRKAPLGEDADLHLAHSPAYVAALRDAAPAQGLARLDPDTTMSPGSLEAALRSVGAGVAAADAVIKGEARNAFLAHRPPGHHAERRRAMGFCLFNTAAITALSARARHGLAKVAVVDFDVHHGNGTQDIFWSDANAFYGSTHQMPLYPGTGARHETGQGNICNAPLAPGDGELEFRRAMERVILPALDSFAPQFLVISAGFDAHERDPLGGLRFVEDDFVWATRELMRLADRHCGGRIVSVLEGGYDLDALAASVAAHVGALMEGA